MAVIVQKHRIRANGKVYVPGDIVEGLSIEEEENLIEQGYCSPEKIRVTESEAESSPVSNEEIEDEGPPTGYPSTSRGRKRK